MKGLLRRLLFGALSTATARRAGWPARTLLLLVLAALVYGLGEYEGRRETRRTPLPLAQGQRLDCDLRSVHDGDTVRLDCDGASYSVRVWGIDAPELKQKPWGEAARDALRAALPSRVRLEVIDTDRYKRTVGRLWRGNDDVGLELVRRGQVAVYEQYNDSAEYRRVEAQARRQRLGIWSVEGAQQTPWAWRRVNKAQ